MHATLQRRLQQARRPKVIVAGLAPRLECFLDAEGDFAGAVSTFAIFHRDDDVPALRELTAALLTRRQRAWRRQRSHDKGISGSVPVRAAKGRRCGNKLMVYSRHAEERRSTFRCFAVLYQRKCLRACSECHTRRHIMVSNAFLWRGEEQKWNRNEVG
jgi:hypothetical protein